MIARRPLLMLPLALPAAAPWVLSRPAAAALSPVPPRFARDHGAHLEQRTEWWYLTGHGESADGNRYGLQVTFFRTRIDGAQSLRSRLAARQLLFAHAAVTDGVAGRHWHEQRIARWNPDATSAPGDGEAGAASANAMTAHASVHDTDVRIGRWQLQRQAGGLASDDTRSRYRARISGGDLQIDLNAEATQALLLQGERGLSRKGPEADAASLYYSVPQLRWQGRVVLPGARGRAIELQGTAWLDHEWSDGYMSPQAVGWDWVGMNLDDGSSLMAFQMREANGRALWAGGAWRSAARGSQPLPDRVFAAGDVKFEPESHWSSPRTGARYPVAWRLRTPVGDYRVQALLADQELDSRRSTGTIYWEGLSELQRAGTGQRAGLGYLEMTGYAAPLRI